MNGVVDESRRALVDIQIRADISTTGETVTVWIDTAFNGYLVCARELIAKLRLNQSAATEAILADGSRVTLEAYRAYVQWFGTIVTAQVVANDGVLPLLGTELLAGRILQIDYENKVVEIR